MWGELAPPTASQERPCRGRRASSPEVRRRLLQLYAGLVLYGVSMALMVRSSLGVMPWDVLHQGLSRHLGWSLGTVTIVVGALVLLAWVPLRERPGLGTLSNVVVVGLAVDAVLAVLPAPGGLAGRVAFAAAGILLNGVATAAYIGVHLCPGSRWRRASRRARPRVRAGGRGRPRRGPRGRRGRRRCRGRRSRRWRGGTCRR